MNYLIDTHAALWFLSGDESLSDKAKDIIESTQNVYISVASLWEISIKLSINKLDIILPNINEFIEHYVENRICGLHIMFNKLIDVRKDNVKFIDTELNGYFP